MIIQSTVELTDDNALHIYDSVYKHHKAVIELVEAGDAYAIDMFLSWFQSEEFNIWTIDFNGDNDDYLIEVCPRDYPNDVHQKFVKPTKFKYSYVVTSYGFSGEVRSIELPLEYWKFLHSDMDEKFIYKSGYETWPEFQWYVRNKYILDVPKLLLTNNNKED